MQRINLVQSEYLATDRSDTSLSTPMGSCIAACLHDGVAHLGGVSHFLLGQPDVGQQISAQDMQQYGVHTIAHQRDDAVRGVAIVRKGGHLLDANIIAWWAGIGHADTGGTRTRKVEFLPFDGKARASFAAEPLPPPRVLSR